MERNDVEELLSSVSAFSSVSEESSLRDRWQTEQQSLRFLVTAPTKIATK